MRIGHGIDVHAFAEGRPLWLGGVLIPFHLGLDGHSDADVVIHALCDALLGAAHLRDIGFHFPDTPGNAFENIDSKVLLKEVMQMIRKQHYRVVNADITICAQQPKLSAHIPLMEETIASVMGIGVADVSIKATTTEHLGFLGREEGILSSAVVLLDNFF